MNKALRIIVLLCYSIYIGSCSKLDENIGIIPELSFEEASPGFKITDSFDNIKVFQLELTDSCIVDEVRRMVEVDNDLLIVLTKNELLTFDKNTGKFIHGIGAIGEGPEEYLNITDFYYNNADKSINIIDTHSGKIVRYGLSGNFISKEKIDFPTEWMTSLTRSDNGYMILSNMLTGGKLTPPSEYAYTVVEPNRDYYSFDPFAPVVLDSSYATKFASKPAVALGDRFTFFKFLNDTIFTMDSGEISPVYKLLLKKRIPQKDIVAQTGDYFNSVVSMNMSGDYIAGLDEIYETAEYIVLVPLFFPTNGYYWINKVLNSGIHIPSSVNFDLTMEQLLSGESIFEIKGSNKNSLICSFDGISIQSAKKCIAKHPELACFNENVKSVFENANPEGNPVVIFYNH